MDATTSLDGPRSPVAGTERVRRASTVAGTALLAMAILAGFGNVFVVERLVVPGDATQTTANLRGAAGLFRAGVASLLAVVVLDVVVARSLYTVFEPANRRLSRLAAWFRLAYAGVFAVAVGHLLTAIETATGASALAPRQRQLRVLQEVTAFSDVWTVALVVFACHLLVLAALLYDASYTPDYLAVLVAVAGLGYLADGLGAVLVAGYSYEVATVTFVGEVVLLVWLLVRGRTVTLGRDGQHSRE
jgi:hypothetical protein